MEIMDRKLAFQILGLLETKDENEIRQKYLLLLKDTNPEDDPEGFKRLREAYEEALRFSKIREEDEEQEPADEVGLWMRRVRKTYRDIFLRRETDTWKELFEDPVCDGLDTFLETRSRLLGYLSDYPFLPQSVWLLLDQVFHVMEDFDDLEEDFHVNFLRHIEYHLQTEDFLDYGLFEKTAEGYRPEKEEDTDNYFREFFKIRESLEQAETEGILQRLSDLRRFGLYHPYEDVEKLRLLIRTKECGKGRELAQQLIERYPKDDYVQIWTGKIFYETGERERAQELWEAVLLEEPDYYMAKYFAVHALVEQENWYKAERYIQDLIKVNRHDQELQETKDRIDEALIPLLQEVLAAGAGYEDLSREETAIYLGWRFFNQDRNEDGLQLLEKEGMAAGQEEDFYELQAWLLYRMKRYEEAISVFRAHLEQVAANEDDEKKKRAKSAQSHRCMADCFYELGESEKGEKEAQAAIETEPDARLCMESRRYLAGKYLFYKKYEKAVELCDTVLAENEEYYPAYLIRQEACYHMDRAQQVVDDYYSAIDLYGGYDKPYLYAAIIFYDYDQYENAKGVIDRARENQVEFSDRLLFQEAKILRMLAESEEERRRPREIVEGLLEKLEKEQKEKGEKEKEEREKEENEKEAAGNRQVEELDKANLLFELGLLHYSSDENEQAVSLIRQAVREDPGETWYRYVLGNVYRSMDRYKEALAEYHGVEKDYQNAEMYFNMGICHEGLSEWTKAIGFFEKVIELDDQYRDTNRRLYNCYEERFCIEYRKADYDKALFYINKQLELTEDGYRYWNRAYLYDDGMETEKAVRDYEKALPMVAKADQYSVLENIGYSYKGDRQFEKAYEAYRKAVDCMEPKNASDKGYAGMAECSKKLGDYERAIACCKEGLAQMPDNESLWDLLRDIYEETDRFEEALAAEQSNYEHGESAVDYYANVSLIQLRMGKVQESLDTLEKGRKALLADGADKRDLAELYDKLGDRYEEMAEYAEAAQQFQKAVALRGENDFWGRFNGEIDLVKNYYMTGEYEKARCHGEKALQCLAARNTTPEDYMNWPGREPVRTGQIGWIYLALGEKEKGRDCLERMEKLRPCRNCGYARCFEASLWLGYYYYCEKEYAKAAELMEETLRRFPQSLNAEYLLRKLRETGKRVEEK